MDNSQCKVEGIRNVFISIFDGNIPNLRNVRSALALRRNLTSLNTLDAQGYRFVVEGGILKICKRALFF